MVIDMDNVPHYHCADCYHNVPDKTNRMRSRCKKRIDHEILEFSKIPFSSDYCQIPPCAEFIPPAYSVDALRRWTGFEDFWAGYVAAWLPYQNTDILLGFCLNGDTSVRYGVPLMDYVNGTMYSGNRLKAVEKRYYRQIRKGFGYELVREQIDGVNLPDNYLDRLEVHP